MNNLTADQQHPEQLGLFDVYEIVPTDARVNERRAAEGSDGDELIVSQCYVWHEPLTGRTA